MSYRLVNGNYLAEKYSEVNDLPCIYADLPNGLDDEYYDMTENARLRERNEQLNSALGSALARLSAASEVAGGGFFDARFCDELRELGVEVDA